MIVEIAFQFFDPCAERTDHLFTIHFSPFTVHHSLFTIHCSLNVEGYDQRIGYLSYIEVRRRIFCARSGVRSVFFRRQLQFFWLTVPGSFILDWAPRPR